MCIRDSATGGDAALIARGVERIDHVDPDITLNLSLIHIFERAARCDGILADCRTQKHPGI